MWWLFMIISNVLIITKRIRVYCSIFVWQKDFFIYNKQNNTWMFGNMKLFLVLNRISHSLALLTREISWSTREVNFIFPHIHVLFSIYYTLTNNRQSIVCVIRVTWHPNIWDVGYFVRVYNCRHSPKSYLIHANTKWGCDCRWWIKLFNCVGIICSKSGKIYWIHLSPVLQNI